MPDLQARVRALEVGAERTREAMAAVVATVVETRDDVRWLKRATQQLLAHNGLVVPPQSDDP
jgi:hypothetical protein